MGHPGGSVGHWALDFGSGRDLGVVRPSPRSGSVLSVQSASLPPFFLPPPHPLKSINL